MYNVLLVEDERWVRVVLRQMVERTGLPFRIVHECTNGLEALDWLKEGEADLVLADVKMPVMDGLAFVEELNRLDRKPSVVMVSGHDDFPIVQMALRCGVKDYLLKPVEKEDMHACLSRWMEGTARPPEEPAAEADTRTADEISTIQQVLRIIHERLPGEVSLTEVATKVHLNPSYLSQLFKQQTGQKFVDYVVSARMEEAKRLLTKTALRITEIADRLGYSDVAYFSSAFKKATGKTPLEFRRAESAEKIR